MRLSEPVITGRLRRMEELDGEYYFTSFALAIPRLAPSTTFWET